MRVFPDALVSRVAAARLFPSTLLGLAFATLAPGIFSPAEVDAAELYGSVKLSPAFWKPAPQGKEKPTRRLSLPQAKIPLGYFVGLDGEPFKGQDLGKPQPERATLIFEGGGFTTRFAAVMKGGDVEVDNRSGEALSLSIAGKDPISVEPKSKKQIPADTTGELWIQAGQDSAMVVVWATPYIIDLDDTGEFAFEGLNDGDYTISVFGLRQNGEPALVQQLPVHLEGARLTVQLRLGETTNGKAKDGAQREGATKDVTPAEGGTKAPSNGSREDKDGQ